MAVKQLSVFIENTPGSLVNLTKLLGENKIDLISLSVADTSSFGILRGIVKNPDDALQTVLNAGFAARLDTVIPIEVPDKPGSLSNVLGILAEAGIFIEYLYSFMRDGGKEAYIILRTMQTEEAKTLLKNQNVRILTAQEVYSL
ncbi:MAG: amino acid-binding protein [Eubacteriales bacterium]|nr:amino acid-binding protein [Eubacteriales bacterium]